MEKQELQQGNYVRKFSKFIFEKMNLTQVLKAITQWLILLSLIYIAYKITDI